MKLRNLIFILLMSVLFLFTVVPAQATLIWGTTPTDAELNSGRTSDPAPVSPDVGGVHATGQWVNGAFDIDWAIEQDPTTFYWTYIYTITTTSSDTRASFSNYGNWIDIAAPGASILTTNRGGGYGYWNGTSFASPIAAGLAGLIISANPDLTNTQVVEIITQNADDLGDPGFDQYYGYGRVNACASLVAAIGTAPEPDITDPLVSIASPDEGSTVSGSIGVSVSATDNVGVERVELYIDGAFFGTSATNPHNFYWNTNDLPEGYYELSAIAYDTSGNIGHSNSVTVYVHNQQEEDITLPVVSITSPADGAHLSKLVKITVLASDNIGVTRMQLYVDGLLMVDKQASAISWPWNVKKASNGEHIISSKAYDAAGNVGTDSITVYK